MQSNNPILNRVEVVADYSRPMTVEGAVQKSVLLTGIAAAIGLFFYIWCAFNSIEQGMSYAFGGWVVGMIGSLILGLVITFKPNSAPALAVPYSAFEGLFLGAVSFYFELRYPGIASQALLATFAAALTMFGLYRFGIIRATEKFKSMVISATLAIAAVYLVQWIMVLAFGSSIPGLFESSWLGIGFAVFVVIIATLNLILDFDLIENAAAGGAPKSFEWVCGVSLLATLVWMYISMLRLLSLLQDD